MKAQGWCRHTKGEVTPTVEAEYYWEFCPICGVPKDKDRFAPFKTIDGVFADTLTRILVTFVVLMSLSIILIVLK